MKRKLFHIMRNFARQISRDNVSAHAASTAFFLFLSLIPLLMLICAILPYTPVTEAMLMEIAVSLTPNSANGLLIYLIGEVYDRSAGVLSAAAVITVWTAAKGMMALMRGLNAVNGVTEQRGYILLRIEACLYTVLMLAAMVLALVILVFGNTLARLVLRQVPRLEVLLSLFLHFRFLPVWLILAAVFAIIYTYVPKIRTRLRYQIPGALFTAIAWSVFSWGFSIYVDHFHGLSMYGNLTTVIIIMLWFYFCMYLLLVGANINRYFYLAIRFLYHRRQEKRSRKKGDGR